MRRVTILIVVAGMVMAAIPALAAGQSDLREARQGTSRFHQVRHAESAGYVSTLESLGCFENPGVGGMGLHYLKPSLLDGSVDARTPEALVYEMTDNGKLRLVGVEYIVPADFVDPANPPKLFGQHFHAHPVLPLWVLHAWIWAPNPLGMFEDWNPRVGLCPEGAPIFGS